MSHSSPTSLSKITTAVMQRNAAELARLVAKNSEPVRIARNVLHHLVEQGDAEMSAVVLRNIDYPHLIKLDACREFVQQVTQSMMVAFRQNNVPMLNALVSHCNQQVCAPSLNRLACEWISQNDTAQLKNLFDLIQDHTCVDWKRLLQAASTSSVNVSTFEWVLNAAHLTTKQQTQPVAYWLVNNDQLPKLDLLRQKTNMTTVPNTIVGVAASCGHLHLVHALLPISDWSHGFEELMPVSLCEALRKGHMDCFEEIKPLINEKLFHAIFYEALKFDASKVLQVVIDHAPLPMLTSGHLESINSRARCTPVAANIVSKCLAAQPKEPWLAEAAQKAAHNANSNLLRAIWNAHCPEDKDITDVLNIVRGYPPKQEASYEMAQAIGEWISPQLAEKFLSQSKNHKSDLHAVLSAIHLNTVLTRAVDKKSIPSKSARKM